MRSRALTALLVLSGLLAVAACGGGGREKPFTVSLRAGGNDPQDLNIAVLMFLPQKITVRRDTTVRWQLTGPEPHTVTFLPAGQQPPSPDSPEATAPKPPTGPYDGTAFVSSGLAPTGGAPVTFSLRFSKPGIYGYVCTIHPGMTGTVTVVERARDAETQAQINERAKAEGSQWLAEGRAAKKRLVETAPRTLPGPGGSSIHVVEMGTTTPHTDILAFQPARSAIKAGDRVLFINNSGAPHTATFAGTKQLPQNPESAEAMRPTGASPLTLNLTDLFNTGWLPPNAPPGAGPPEAARSFTFVVPRAGTYAYVCLLHAPSVMSGTIEAS
jgi:plastocyanin